MEENKLYVKSWQQNAVEIFLYFFAGAQAVSFMTAAITKDISTSLPYLLLSLCCFWILFLDYKVKNIIVFFLAHLPLGGLVFLSSTWSVQALCGVYAAALIGYSFHLRYARRDVTSDNVSLLVIVMLLYAIMYMACSTADILSYRQVLLTSSIFFSILYMAAVHAVKVDQTLFHQNQQHMDQPVSKIRRTNRTMVLSFLVIMVVVFELLLLIPWDSGTGSGGALLSLLWMAIRWLMEAFSSLFVGQTSEDSFVFESASDQDPSTVYGGASAAWIWVFMTKVLYVFMALLAIAVIVYAVYRIYTGFYGRKRHSWSAIEETETDDTEEYIPREKKQRLVRRGFSLRASNEEKVRKLFYKKVYKKMGHQVRCSDTPEQMDEKLPDERLTELVSWYDQARYSTEAIRDEDWKAISEKHR